MAGAVLFGCASSRGSTYERGSTGESSALARAKAANKEKEEKEEEEEPSYQASSSWDSSDADDTSGLQLLSLLFPASDANSQSAPSGYLDLDNVPLGASVTVDGHYAGNYERLEPGRYSLEIKAFGYYDYQTVVQIELGKTTVLSYPKRPIPFELHNVTARFLERDELGVFGNVWFFGEATAPGFIAAIVVDDQNQSVSYVSPMPATSVLWSSLWSGRDSSGKLLAPGTYTARFYQTAAFTASPSEWSIGKPLAEIDFSIHQDGTPLRAGTQFSGVSGSLFAPDARSLSFGHLDMGIGIIAHTQNSQAESSFRAPLWYNIRMGLLRSGGLELGLSGMLIPSLAVNGTDVSSGELSGTVKATLFRARGEACDVAVAAWLRMTGGSFLDEDAGGWASPWDGATKYPGNGLGLVGEFKAGPARLFAGAELALSSFYPGWDDAKFFIPGFFAWTYFRAGTDVIVPLGPVGSLSCRLSGALRSEVLSESFKLRPPYSVGAEIQWYSPQSSFIPSLIAVAEIDSLYRYFIYGGFAVNWVF